MQKLVNASEVRKGDIVRFIAYSLRVEAEPVVEKGRVILHGRTSADGCPLVTRRYLPSAPVKIDRT